MEPGSEGVMSIGGIRRELVTPFLFVHAKKERERAMTKLETVTATASLLILLATGAAFAEEAGVSRGEIDAMKNRLEQLEEILNQRVDVIEEKWRAMDRQITDKPRLKKAPGPEIEAKMWFEKLEMGIGGTGILQGSAGASEKNVNDGSMSFDLELTAPIAQHGRAFAHLEAGNGDGVDGDIPTLSGFNDDADDDMNARLTELWYEYYGFGECLRLRGGKVDLTAVFDANEVANDETTQFLSGGFVNNLAVEFPDDNGCGAMLWASPQDFWNIGLGAADADADWGNVFDDIFSILELDFRPTFNERPGNYRVYGWINARDHEDLKNPTRTTENNYGFGLSFDQALVETVSAFARYGWQRGRVSQVEHAWSVGLQCSGQFYGRKDDALGLAYGMAIIGSDYSNVDRTNGINTGNEHHVEAYYNFKAGKYLNISPDIQWIRNPNGDRDNDDVWVFGMRAQLSF